MKYLSVKPIVISLHRILDINNSKEHWTSTSTSGLLQNYFDINKFIITPEKVQEGSGKRPDYTIEKLEDDELVHHLFAEVKSIASSTNFDGILDQLDTAILQTVDSSCVNLSAFIIVMKGIKIGFLEYHSYVSLLNEYNIPNYKGFIPLNYNILENEFLDINKNSQWIQHFIYDNRTNIPTDPTYLKNLGVESSSKIEHPYIWNLLNEKHADYVHNLFKYMADNKSGKYIND